MISCPCCSSQMLRHIRDRQIEWFCRHCWSAMPNCEIPSCEVPNLEVPNREMQLRGSNRQRPAVLLDRNSGVIPG